MLLLQRISVSLTITQPSCKAIGKLCRIVIVLSGFTDCLIMCGTTPCKVSVAVDALANAKLNSIRILLIFKS